MTPPRVTIGIPCYNSARWVRSAIESALAQKGVSKEVIVVDDGSLDSSSIVAVAFGDSIKLIRTEHWGATHARNLILQHAEGEWVQYLDADDYLEPDKVARQLEECGDTAGADVIYSPVWVETLNARTGKVKSREKSFIAQGTDLWVQWFSWQLPQTGGCLWRREALESLLGWKKDQPCCQEHELYLRALEAGQRFVFTPTPHAVYRIWSEATLCRKDPSLVVREKTRLIDDAAAWLRVNKKWTKAHRHAAGRACFEMARTLAKESIRNARAYYKERKRAKLIRASGPAAPLLFKLFYYPAGFTAAEWVARALRTLHLAGKTPSSPLTVPARES